MRLYIQIIFPIFVVVVVYSLLTFFFGISGIFSQKIIERETISVIKNIGMIRQKGIELDVLIKNLTTDEETIKIFAHNLGYVGESETIIKLSPSLKINPLSEVSCGSAVTIHKSAFISDAICKKLAILIGIVSLIIEVLIVKSYDYQEREIRVLSYS